jgi:hypothetical protein
VYTTTCSQVRPSVSNAATPSDNPSVQHATCNTNRATCNTRTQLFYSPLRCSPHCGSGGSASSRLRARVRHMVGVHVGATCWIVDRVFALPVASVASDLLRMQNGQGLRAGVCRGKPARSDLKDPKATGSVPWTTNSTLTGQGNVQNIQHATCSTQHATCTGQRAAVARRSDLVKAS